MTKTSNEKIRLSATLIKAFGECKQKFIYRVIDKKPIDIKPDIFTVIGKSIHKCIECFYRNSETFQREELLGSWESTLRHEIKRNLIEIQEKDFNKHLKSGYSMLENVYKSQSQDGLLIKPQGVETKFEIPFSDDIDLVGKMDLVVDNTVIDWKTGRRVNYRKIFNDFQIPIYAYAFRKMFGEKEKDCYYLYVAYNKKIRIVVDDDRIKKLLDKIWYISEFIKNPTISYNNNDCKYCEFSGICEHFNENGSQGKTRFIESEY